MICLRKVFTGVVLAWFLGWGMLCMPVVGRDVKVTICPRKMAAEPGQLSLLPPEGVLKDGDAAPLYEKARKALPGTDGDEQIRKWLDMPLDQLCRLSRWSRRWSGIRRA